MSTGEKKRGRPLGSKTQVLPVVRTIPTLCPLCGSAERSGYCDCSAQDYDGETPDGFAFSRVETKRTQCLSCGQWRFDKIYFPRNEDAT
jgi:hypothetical protein